MGLSIFTNFNKLCVSRYHKNLLKIFKLFFWKDSQVRFFLTLNFVALKRPQSCFVKVYDNWIFKSVVVSRKNSRLCFFRDLMIESRSPKNSAIMFPKTEQSHFVAVIQKSYSKSARPSLYKMVRTSRLLQPIHLSSDGQRLSWMRQDSDLTDVCANLFRDFSSISSARCGWSEGMLFLPRPTDPQGSVRFPPACCRGLEVAILGSPGWPGTPRRSARSRLS